MLRNQVQAFKARSLNRGYAISLYQFSIKILVKAQDKDTNIQFFQEKTWAR